MSPNSKGVEILSIGTELLLGNIINTNAQWISEELSCSFEFESFCLISSHKCFLSKRGTLKDLAIASVVKSSGVGPKPPVVIRRLLLFDIS